jgi:hypothetical protein
MVRNVERMYQAPFAFPLFLWDGFLRTLCLTHPVHGFRVERRLA